MINLVYFKSLKVQTPGLGTRCAHFRDLPTANNAKGSLLEASGINYSVITNWRFLLLNYALLRMMSGVFNIHLICLLLTCGVCMRQLCSGLLRQKGCLISLEESMCPAPDVLMMWPPRWALAKASSGSDYSLLCVCRRSHAPECLTNSLLAQSMSHRAKQFPGQQRLGSN